MIILNVSILPDPRTLDINLKFYGYSEEVLIDQVGRKMSEKVSRLLPKDKKQLNGLFLIGPGNNGADGLSLLRRLSEKLGKKKHFFDVVLYTTELKPSTESQLLASLPYISNVYLAETFQKKLYQYDFVVDAFFGTGLKDSINTSAEAILEKCKVVKTKISVDLPTPGFRADYVFSILTKKLPNAELISLDYPKILNILTGPGNVLSLEGFSEGHKGTNGKILIVAGSNKYLGSLYFSCYAASQFCDLVYFYSPRNESKMRNECPEAIPVSFAEAQELLEENKIEACALGPGIGNPTKEVRSLMTILTKKKTKCIIDAEGIDLYLDTIKRTGTKNQNVLLTPHRGEFLRNFGKEPSVQTIATLADRLNLSIIVKGKIDILSDGRRLRLNPFGNQGLTKGGTGDTLTGLITAFSCKNNLFDSACGSVFLLTACADHLSQQMSMNYSIRTLIEHIPKFLNMLKNKNLTYKDIKPSLFQHLLKHKDILIY